MGQFVNAREYPDAAFKDVTAPNADTLYSIAWLDLSKEPYVLSLPDEGDRYFLMPMLTAGPNVFQVPGKRTTGDKAQTYAITGPSWKGELPEGVKELKSPTEHGVDPRPHLLHRHAGGLQGGPRHPGQVQAGPAQRLRQALHAARARSIRTST